MDLALALQLNAVDPLNPINLPYFAARSLLRLTLAFGLSLGFALAYGIAAAMSRRASHVLLPVLDVLQSVPVLGFLPAVFIFVLTRVPGEGGQELASIILIFTAMVWAMTFAVITGINQIPNDIKEASKAYGITRSRYLRQVVLPAIYPELIWGCILAWGGAWYFIPVEEYATFGMTQVQLKGLGFFIAQAAAESRLDSAIIGLVAMVLVIIAINRIVWRPLVARTEKYRYEVTGGQRGFHARHGKLRSSLLKYEGRIANPIVTFFKYEKTNLSSFLETVPRVHVPPKVRERLARIFLVTRVIVIIGFLGLMVLVIFFLENSPIPTLQAALNQIQSFQPIKGCTGCLSGFPLLAYSTASSLLRLLAAYLIALGWTLLAGIAIARRQKLAKALIPIFDIGQSIPATALFPIVTLLILSRISSPMGIQLASIVLLLTGMQWYLLFNIIGAIHNIPNDISESTSAYGVSGKRFIREILIPASFPAIISGSMQAWGGGWNATIVSEYIVTGQQQVQQVAGLGAVLVNANNAGSAGTVVIATAIVIMTLTILIINRLVWHRLMKRADRYKFES